MPNFPYKLAAVDLDDTLLGPDKLIGSANTDAIRSLQARGVKIVLASGRRLENMRRYCSELGLIGPVITCQGASVVDLTTGESIYERQLDEAKSRAVIEAGLARDLTIIAYQHEGTFANRRNRLTDLYDLRSGESKVIVKELNNLTGQMLKVLWLDEPAHISTHSHWARQHLPFVHSVATDPEYLELMDWSANKGDALEALASSLGIEREAVLAFGDGNNDASMLAWAGLGIAMPHGTESARLAAKQIGPPALPEVALAASIGSLLSE